ncbi:hypothetical protein JCM1840_005167, partial [Sporobolomyces johnsonii]
MFVVTSTSRAAASRRFNLASAASLAAGSTLTAALRTRLAYPPSRGFARPAGKDARPEARSAEQKKPQAEASKTIQTIPFVLSPANGLNVCRQAAHIGFGFSAVCKDILSRILRPFGVSYDSGVEQLAFRPVLLPVWKVDLAMTGKALVDETQYNLFLSVFDASIPGFDHPQLAPLAIQSDWDVSPVPFSQARHATQHSRKITILPFTREPFNLLDKLSSFPRTTAERHGMVLNPARFEPHLFALYPMYLPLYLGEFKLGDKLVTTAAFATANKADYAIYRQFDPSPQWRPPRAHFHMHLIGFPSSLAERRRAQEMGVLELKLDSSRVNRLVRELLEDARNQAEGKIYTLTDEIERERGIGEVIRGNQSVMGFAEWADHNREYMAARHLFGVAQAMLEQVKDM